MNKELHDFIMEKTFEERKNIFQAGFTLNATTTRKLNSKLYLISLVCLASKKAKLTTRELLEKITKKNLEDNTEYCRFLSSLAIICDDLLYEVDEIDTLGFKDSKTLIAKIQQLLNEWMPF